MTLKLSNVLQIRMYQVSFCIAKSALLQVELRLGKAADCNAQRIKQIFANILFSHILGWGLWSFL